MEHYLIVGFFAFLAFILISGVLSAAILRSKGVPNSSLKKGYKKMFLSYVTIVLLWSVIFFGLRQSIENSLFFAGLILSLIAYIWMIIFQLRSRSKPGKVLLSLTLSPFKSLALIGGFFIIIIGFFGGYSFAWKNSQYSWLVSSIVGLYIGSSQFFLAFSIFTTQICERGIVAAGVLVKWEKIESFEWTRSNQQTYVLKLKFRDRPPNSKREGMLIVPVEKQPELATILEKYLGTLDTSTQSHA